MRPSDADIERRMTLLKQLTEEDSAEVGGVAPGCEACGQCTGAGAISTRSYTDAQLLAWLEAERWNVYKAAYTVLLRKAEHTQVTLSSGIVLPDNSAYWLRLAQSVRRNRTGMALRADEARR